MIVRVFFPLLYYCDILQWLIFLCWTKHHFWDKSPLVIVFTPFNMLLCLVWYYLVGDLAGISFYNNYRKYYKNTVIAHYFLVSENYFLIKWRENVYIFKLFYWTLKIKLKWEEKLSLFMSMISFTNLLQVFNFKDVAFLSLIFYIPTNI